MNTGLLVLLHNSEQQFVSNVFITHALTLHFTTLSFHCINGVKSLIYLNPITFSLLVLMCEIGKHNHVANLLHLLSVCVHLSIARAHTHARTNARTHARTHTHTHTHALHSHNLYCLYMSCSTGFPAGSSDNRLQELKRNIQMDDSHSAQFITQLGRQLVKDPARIRASAVHLKKYFPKGRSKTTRSAMVVLKPA